MYGLMALLLLPACTAAMIPQTRFLLYIESSQEDGYLYRWEKVKFQATNEFDVPNPQWEALKAAANTPQKIQKLVNEFPYHTDYSQFQQDEYWQTPYEFLAHGGGDCEDYAITKYYLMKNIGYTDDQLQIVLLKVPGGEGHAVLTVKIGDKVYLMDNRYVKMIDVTKIPEEYRPYYGMNDHHYFKYF